MSRNVLVLAEVCNGALRAVSFECIAAGRRVATLASDGTWRRDLPCAMPSTWSPTQST